jgi:hypothetical protein
VVHRRLQEATKTIQNIPKGSRRIPISQEVPGGLQEAWKVLLNSKKLPQEAPKTLRQGSQEAPGMSEKIPKKLMEAPGELREIPRKLPRRSRKLPRSSRRLSGGTPEVLKTALRGS